MKKTQFIELLNNIKKTMVSFISITVFIALGVAIFCGVSWSSTAVTKGLDEVLKETNFHDIELLFPYGMSESDLDSLRQIEGVDEVEGSYVAYNYFTLNDTLYQIKLLQLHDDIDTPFEIEGTLPTSFNEMALDKMFAKEKDVHIGDIIKLVSDNDGSYRALVKIMEYDAKRDDLTKLTLTDDNKMAHLKTDTFKVTALVKDGEYLSSNSNNYGVSSTNKQMVNCYAYLPKIAFDETSYVGYSDILIKSNSLRQYSTFSNEYTEHVDVLTKRINEQIVDNLLDKKEKTWNDAIKSIDTSANTKLDEALKQIKENEKKIEDGQIALNDAKRQLNEGIGQLEAAQIELDAGIARYDEGKAQFDQLEYAVVRVVELLNRSDEEIINNSDTIIEYLNNIKSYTEENVDVLIDVLINRIDNGFLWGIHDIIGTVNGEINNYLNEQKAVLDAGYAEILDAQAQIEAGWITYYQNLAEYNRNSDLLQEGQLALDKAKIEYDDYLNQYNNIKDRIPTIGKFESTILTRKFNASLVIGEQLKNSLSKVRFSMASLFLIVGLLVCYSALSRIINDQTILIGTKKALGLSNKEITLSYLMYTGISLVLGCAIGAFLAYFAVERVLVNSAAESFICFFDLAYDTNSLIIICAIHIVLLLTISYLACASILKRKAVDLLANNTVSKTKKHFFEKTRLWNKIPLFMQTIINNFINDKRRVFGTIVGIAGATALIVTALTLNDNVANSFKLQYDKYYHFDTIINYDSDNENANKNIKEVLDSYDAKSIDFFFARMYNVTPDDNYIMSYLFVPTNKEGFGDFIDFEKETNLEGDMSNGYWMCLSYYNFYKPSSNDGIKLLTSDGKEGIIVPNGYFKYYLINYQNIMDIKTYEETYDEKISSNAFLVSTKDCDKDELLNKLKKVDGYVNTIDYYDTTYEAFATMQKVSKAMVVVYMVLSVVMGFLVLLNILVLFINEKKKELIILMINGYSRKQAKKYIYSDTIFLTIISIIIGIVVGNIIGNISVVSFENSVTVFLHQIDVFACVVGGVASALLTTVISIISLRKIDKLTLSEINEM